MSLGIGINHARTVCTANGERYREVTGGSQVAAFTSPSATSHRGGSLPVITHSDPLAGSAVHRLGMLTIRTGEQQSSMTLGRGPRLCAIG